MWSSEYDHAASRNDGGSGHGTLRDGERCSSTSLTTPTRRQSLWFALEPKLAESQKEWAAWQWSIPSDEDEGSEDDAKNSLLGRNADNDQSSARELGVAYPAGPRMRRGSTVDADGFYVAGSYYAEESRPSPLSESQGGMTSQKITRVERLRRMVQANSSPWVIHPLRPQVLAWNCAMLVFVALSVFALPFEAAFLGSRCSVLQSVNRVSDVVFVADMVLQLFLANLDPGTQTLCFNHMRIVAIYFQGGHFPCDIISIMPIGFMFDQFAPQAPPIFVRGSQFLKLCRLFRVPRLLLFYRFKRGLSYGAKTLLQSAMMVIVVAHIMACAWGLLGQYGGSAGATWMDIGQGVENAAPFRDLEAWGLYTSCLYWAVFTLTGIGYGDIYPQTNMERVVGVAGMLIGAITWAVVVANIISIVGIWSAADATHEVRMDELEEMMEDRQFEEKLRIELREYFKRRSVRLEKFGHMRETIARMSPRLAAQAVEALHGEQFCRVNWLKGLVIDESKIHGPFLVDLAERLDCQLYCPGEAVSVRQALVIVLHGTAILRGEGVVVGGNVWGEDMLLDNPKLRRSNSAMALTFLEVAFLQRIALDQITDSYPLAKHHIRRHKCRMAVTRGILYYAGQEKKLQLEQELQAAEKEKEKLPSSNRSNNRKKSMIEHLRVQGSNSRLDLEVVSTTHAVSSRSAGRLDHLQVPHHMPHDIGGKLRSQPFSRQDSLRSQSSNHHVEGGRLNMVESQLLMLTRGMERLTTKVDNMQASILHQSYNMSQASYMSQEGESASNATEVEHVLQEGADPDLRSETDSTRNNGELTPRTLKAFTSSVPNRNRSRTGSSLNLISENG